MKVSELRDMLIGLPDDMEVILQKDSEGNGYSPLAGGDQDCLYNPYNTWSGDVYSTDETAEDAGFDEEEWEEMKKKPRCLVLFPIN